MKKMILVLVLALTVSFLFAGGSGEAQDDGVTKVALLINGTLGDKSFHDSANNGMKLLSEELGCKTKVVEVGYDDSKWEPALRDLCDEKHDIIVCGTWQMQELVQKVAPDYPDQKIIVYDTAMDYASDTKGDFKNIYSIEYLQNDGAFLAGILAAELTETGIIGFVGGMDNTVIYDFLVGYIQGAKTVKPDVKVVSSFVGNFSDSAKAKELTFAQYQIGADIVFSCASNAGEGVLQASKERGKLVIGVDSDQAMLYMDSDPVLGNLIASSVLKRVDQSIYLAVQSALDGTLAWGTRVALGISDGCVGLADNEVYQTVVPEEVRNLISEYEGKIKSGEVKVVTAFGMTNDELLSYVDSARP